MKKNLFLLLICIFIPSISYAVNFSNPLQFNTVEGVLTSLLGTLQGIIVVLSIIFIVIGAILYITSAGNENQIGTAKKAITASMIGLAIGIAAPSFLKEVAGILGWSSWDACQGLSGSAYYECVNSFRSLSLSEIILNVLNFLLSIVGVLGVIMLVIAGIMYLTSAGNERRIDTAKNMTTYALIGIAVALASLVIVKQIARFFV